MNSVLESLDGRGVARLDCFTVLDTDTNNFTACKGHGSKQPIMANKDNIIE